MEAEKAGGHLVSGQFKHRKEHTMKMWIILIACALLCGSVLSCGDDGTNKSHWACECTGGDTTSVCSDSSGDAVAQAIAQLCDGQAECGCDCVDTLVEQGC